MSSGSGDGLPRAVTLAALSVLLTAVGHLAGGGSVPDLGILVVLLPLLAGMFVTIARRCRGAVATVAILGAGQVALHQLIVLLHPAHQLADPAVPPGAAMLGMHAVVTVVTAVVLRHADAAVGVLAAALCRVLPRRLLAPPADHPLPTHVVPGPAVPARIARALAVAHLRRGPPVGC